MEIVGYIASIAIGVALGLIGGGGSILTVPLLAYIFGIESLTATTYSLFIVGLTSGIGSISYFKNGLINLKTAILFGIPSIIAIFITRTYIVPAIPSEILSINGFVLTKSIFIMLLFAVLMIAASYKMINSESRQPSASILDDLQITPQEPQINYLAIVLAGGFVGFLTNLVGAGGGFLIIPALVLLFKLPMKEAVGTSLAIISVNSLIGFAISSPYISIDWRLILTISAFSVSGIFIGTALSKKIEGSKLKPAFGWFILAMGIYIILKETYLK